MGNCNRFFLFGVLALLIGVQLRVVDTYILTPKASEIIERRTKSSAVQTFDQYETYWPFAGPTPQKTISPPDWLGWSLISAGAVLVLTCPRFK